LQVQALARRVRADQKPRIYRDILDMLDQAVFLEE